MTRRAVIVRCGWGAAVGVCILAILAIAGGQDHAPLSPATLPPPAAQTAPRLPAYPPGLLPPNPEFYAGLGGSPIADSSRGQPVIAAGAQVPAAGGQNEVVSAAGPGPGVPESPASAIVPAMPITPPMPVPPATAAVPVANVTEGPTAPVVPVS